MTLYVSENLTILLYIYYGIYLYALLRLLSIYSKYVISFSDTAELDENII